MKAQYSFNPYYNVIIYGRQIFNLRIIIAITHFKMLSDYRKVTFNQALSDISQHFPLGLSTSFSCEMNV